MSPAGGGNGQGQNERMTTEDRRATVLRLLQVVALIDGGIFVLVGVVCWLAGLRTAFHFGNGVVVLGALVIIFGTLSLGRSQGGVGSRDSTARRVGGVVGPYALAVLFAVAGLLAIVTGVLIQEVFT